MHIFIDSLIGPLFTYFITCCLIEARECFSDSTRRAILLVPTVVNVHPTPPPQLNLYVDPVCNKTEKLLANCLSILILLMGILHDLSISLKLHYLLLPSITEFFIQDPAVNMVFEFGLYLCSGGSGSSSCLTLTLPYSILSCLRQSLTSEQKVLSHEITVPFLIVFPSILQDLMIILNLILRINQEGIVLLASASVYIAVFSHNHKFFSAHCSNPETSALDITYHIPVPADTELPLLENQHSFKEHLPFNYLLILCYKNHVLPGLSYRWNTG